MDNDIAFCCLYPSATHDCQPRVIIFEVAERKLCSILTAYKSIRGKKAQTIQKEKFHFKTLTAAISENSTERLKPDFRITDIYPTNSEEDFWS